MAVYAIMAGGMYMVFNNFSTVKTITDRDSVRLAELQRAFAFIKKDISAIIPRSVKDEFEGDNPLSALTSTGDFIEFTRGGWINPLFLKHKRSELQRVRYALEEGSLKRNYWYVLDRAPDSVSRGLDLLDNVEELSFTFWYHKADSGELVEEQEWPPTDLPSAPNIVPCGIDHLKDIFLPDIVQINIVTPDYGKMVRKFSVLSTYSDMLIEKGC